MFLSATEGMERQNKKLCRRYDTVKGNGKDEFDDWKPGDLIYEHQELPETLLFSLIIWGSKDKI